MEVLNISKAKGLNINDDIRTKEVRLVGEEGEQLGIVSIAQAQKLANEKNLDLVEISPKAEPPVCKIMDYGKHLYEQAKREKEAKKNQKIVSIKEIRLSVKIDTHDFDTKVRNATKFLEAGDKVKVGIRFRGREMAHPDLAKLVMVNFSEAVSGVGTVASPPKLDGRNMSMMINPIAK